MSAPRATNSATTPTSATTISRSSAFSPAPGSTASTPIRRRSINDFLTNPQYGAGFSAASIDATTLFGSGGDASLQTYCKAMGIAFSPCLTDQEQGSSILTRWLQILNCAAVWSGGMLKFIPYGDAAITGAATP